MTAKIPKWFTPTFVVWANIVAGTCNLGWVVVDVIMHRWMSIWVNSMAAVVSYALGWFIGAWYGRRELATGNET